MMPIMNSHGFTPPICCTYSGVPTPRVSAETLTFFAAVVGHGLHGRDRALSGLLGELVLLLVDHDARTPVLRGDVDPLLDVIDGLLASRCFGVRDRLHGAELQVDLGHRHLVFVELRFQLLDERRIGFRLDDRRVLIFDVVNAVHLDVHLRQVEWCERLFRRRILVVRVLQIRIEVQRHQRHPRELRWRDRT
jgi:hypothetical protein